MKDKDGRAVLKSTLRSEIAAYIKHQIAMGRFKPGDRIVETQMAKELNVSQAPVREAILELATMGLLEERPYSGTFVRRLTADDIEDIYNTRAFIEEYAARQAAKKITDQQLEGLEALLREMDDCEDINEFVHMDMHFHDLVVEAAGSPALVRMRNSIHLVEWTELSAQATENSLATLVEQHWEIYRLLKRHADHTAGAYMFLHLKKYGDELKRYFQTLEEMDHQR